MSPKLVNSTYSRKPGNLSGNNSKLPFVFLCLFQWVRNYLDIIKDLRHFHEVAKEKRKKPKIDEGQIKIVNGFVLALIPITS